MQRGDGRIWAGVTQRQSLTPACSRQASKVMVAAIESKSLEAWFVYALRSEKDGWLYVGMSSDVERRITEHNRGYNRSTKSRVPFGLIYKEECGSRQEARRREKYFKSGRGREFLRTLDGRG